MSKPQKAISVQFTREWRIRRPIIYRYLEKEFVDDFFESGKIRLSSFDMFSCHADEERLDRNEGYGSVVHRNHEGQGQTMFAVMAQGRKSFVLCGSTSFRPELSTVFGTDSGFRINDSIAFCEAISKYIPGFYMGLEGPCLYAEKRIVDRDMGSVDLESFKTSPGTEKFDIDKISQFVTDTAGDDLLFIKPARYAHQSEYRLLWQTPHPVSGFIDIICPEARQFCTRFEDLSF